MVSFTRITVIAVVAALSAPIAGAQGVTSDSKLFSFGVSGGVSVPVGDMSNIANTGYNVGGHIALGMRVLPISLRGDVNYDSFDAKMPDNKKDHVWSYTVNAVYEIPMATAIKPYFIGGVGGFTPAFKSTSGNLGYIPSTGTEFGFNVGGGIVIPLSGFNAFVEARYNEFSGSATQRFVPITFGVMF
jgi:opacity protein-like surface antigen